MAESILILNERIQAALVEERITTLSVAVLLHDDFAFGKRPIGNIKVSLHPPRPSDAPPRRGEEREAIQNLSGYYCFTDVEAGTYTIRATSDYYFDAEQEGTLPLSDAKRPVVDITLKPKPFYPFPAGATLIKGAVKDVNEQPILGATVAVSGKAVEAQTTEKGEFVLYFKGLTEDDVIVVNNKRLVKGNGDQTLILEATHPDYETEQVQIEVEEGKTASILITDMQPQ